MLRTMLIASTLLALSVPAGAQDGTVNGAAGGAIAGAVAGGPVGAAIGGVAGAAIGTAIDPPPEEVRTYVTQQSVPSVAIEQEIVVGEALPDTVEYHVVPTNDRYAYTVVNDRRVILDPQTRTVVQVID